MPRSEPTPRSAPQSETPPDDLATLLDRATTCVDAAGSASTPISRRLRELQQRLREGRLHLAVLGQFKRGKSTFLNALLGAPLLPTGVIPLTASPTFIAWGPQPLIRVTYLGARASDEFNALEPDEIRNHLFAFVSEEGNPRNRLGVSRVDLFYPASVLAQGVVLIDTPGIGSSHRHNTDAALQVLSECDAALFVVSADPPITEAELDYLATVRAKVARLFFILNKADYLEAHDLQVAVEFLRRTLQASGSAGSDIFSVSALQGLKARQSGDVATLEKSGMAGVETHLLKFLAQERMISLRQAVAQKAADLLAEAAADLAFRIRTLEMPAEELERRSAILGGALERIEAEKRVIGDLLAGERRRAVDQLEAQAEQLRRTGRDFLAEVLEDAVSKATVAGAESAAQDAIASAIPDLFQRELGETSRAFTRTIEEILGRHQKRIEDLVNLVRRTAAELFAIPYTASAESEGFKLGREPYWVTQRWSDRLLPSPANILGQLLPAAARRARLLAQLKSQASELVQRNVENLRWATLQGLDDTFRRFTAMLEERLAAAIDATHGAAAATSLARRSASDRAASELAALRQTAGILSEIRAELAARAPPEPIRAVDADLP